MMSGAMSDAFHARPAVGSGDACAVPDDDALGLVIARAAVSHHIDDADVFEGQLRAFGSVKRTAIDQLGGAADRKQHRVAFDVDAGERGLSMRAEQSADDPHELGRVRARFERDGEVRMHRHAGLERFRIPDPAHETFKVFDADFARVLAAVYRFLSHAGHDVEAAFPLVHVLPEETDLLVRIVQRDHEAVSVERVRFAFGPVAEVFGESVFPVAVHDARDVVGEERAEIGGGPHDRVPEHVEGDRRLEDRAARGG